MLVRDQYKNIAVHTITFYRYNEDGDVLQDKNGNDIQFECNSRVKSLEHICDDIQVDDLDEINVTSAGTVTIGSAGISEAELEILQTLLQL